MNNDEVDDYMPDHQEPPRKRKKIYHQEMENEPDDVEMDREMEYVEAAEEGPSDDDKVPK